MCPQKGMNVAEIAARNQFGGYGHPIGVCREIREGIRVKQSHPVERVPNGQPSLTFCPGELSGFRGDQKAPEWEIDVHSRS